MSVSLVPCLARMMKRVHLDSETWAIPKAAHLIRCDRILADRGSSASPSCCWSVTRLGRAPQSMHLRSSERTPGASVGHATSLLLQSLRYHRTTRCAPSCADSGSRHTLRSCFRPQDSTGRGRALFSLHARRSMSRVVAPVYCRLQRPSASDPTREAQGARRSPTDTSFPSQRLFHGCFPLCSSCTLGTVSATPAALFVALDCALRLAGTRTTIRSSMHSLLPSRDRTTSASEPAVSPGDSELSLSDRRRRCTDHAWIVCSPGLPVYPLVTWNASETSYEARCRSVLPSDYIVH
ncbi:hypothetical protein C8Q80DRAFT_564741 [Daedaleopsis nitida]|nr:hypothetical protein C8Q80DRAFT_564741 [Daedaleopsis nitida]